MPLSKLFWKAGRELIPHIESKRKMCHNQGEGHVVSSPQIMYPFRNIKMYINTWTNLPVLLHTSHRCMNRHQLQPSLKYLQDNFTKKENYLQNNTMVVHEKNKCKYMFSLCNWMQVRIKWKMIYKQNKQWFHNRLVSTCTIILFLSLGIYYWFISSKKNLIMHTICSSNNNSW